MSSRARREVWQRGWISNPASTSYTSVGLGAQLSRWSGFLAARQLVPSTASMT
ncbi:MULTISPECIES: hypothetical protein [Nocardiaceae]|uniref:hypothetical protein n=1 Tax=Nocardiaceae TaxID=85025 RepID=UPI0012D32014|nr:MULTISPECIES: hypothetical protein [Rhodococcus]